MIQAVKDYLNHINHRLSGCNITSVDLLPVRSGSCEIIEMRYFISVDNVKATSILSEKLIGLIKTKTERQS